MTAKTAFVGSGGGLRAYAFHLGVMHALQEHGFRRRMASAPRHSTDDDDPFCIRSYIGSSAGACFAASAVFCESLDDVERIIGLRSGGAIKLSKRALFRPDLTWLRRGRRFSGVFYASGLAALTHALTGGNDDFRNIGPELYVTATQLNGPRKIIFGPRDSAEQGGYDKYIAYYNDVSISDAVAASASVPVMFRPYRIRSKSSGHVFEYTDGEVRETLSIHVARDTQVERCIISNTWMPYYYQSGAGSISDRGVFAVLAQAISQAIEQKIDRFRYDSDHYRETLSAIREFARWEKLSEEQIENLLGQVSLTLNFREIDEIYIAPDPYDAAFGLIPSFTFDSRALGRAMETGHARATLALASWKQRQ